jgi:hypothetical protein
MNIDRNSSLRGVAGRASAMAFAAVCVAALCMPAFAQDKGAAGDTEVVQRTLTLKSGGSVAVENDRGTTTIDGWDKEQVSIDAVKHFEGDSKLRDQWLRETEVRIENTAQQVRVKVVRPNNFCIGYCNYRGWVDVTLRVPRRVALDLSSDRTMTKVRDIQGDVHVSGDRSEIRLQSIVGAIRVNSDRGPVYLRDVEILNNLEIKTDRAPIEIYATKLSAGGHLQTDRAAITLRMPANTAINLEVDRDRRSSFHTDFPLSTSGNISGYGRLHGSINGGGPTLHLETDRGSINLEKGPPSTGGAI